MHTDSPALIIPTVPGTAFEGGFYVGRLRIASQVCAIILAPKSEGDAKGSAWGKDGRDVPGARSYFDGLANTRAMAEAGSSLAKCMLELKVNGFTDWYLPTRDELELVYRYLKPTADENTRYSGDNPSALPPTWPYSSEAPVQTSALPFQAGGPEAMEPAWYWTSTQYSAHNAWFQWFDDGSQHSNDKSYKGRARAVRRLVIE